MLGRFEGWIKFYKTHWVYYIFSPYLYGTANIWREKYNFNFLPLKCNSIPGLIQQSRNNFDICSFNIWFNKSGKSVFVNLNFYVEQFESMRTTFTAEKKADA